MTRAHCTANTVNLDEAGERKVARGALVHQIAAGGWTELRVAGDEFWQMKGRVVRQPDLHVEIEVVERTRVEGLVVAVDVERRDGQGLLAEMVSNL